MLRTGLFRYTPMQQRVRFDLQGLTFMPASSACPNRKFTNEECMFTDIPVYHSGPKREGRGISVCWSDIAAMKKPFCHFNVLQEVFVPVAGQCDPAPAGGRPFCTRLKSQTIPAPDRQSRASQRNTSTKAQLVA
jgi:hypothetical protein